MQTKHRMFAHLAAGLLLIGASVGLVDESVGQDPTKEDSPGRLVQLKAPSANLPQAQPQAKATAPIAYWIGVKCMGPLPSVLQTHLNLPENQGLLVVDVVPNSPAATAGIKIDDILLTIDDRPLESVLNLVDAVKQSGDQKAMKLGLLREGKMQSVDLTPARRPAEMAGGRPFAGQPQDHDPIQQWFEQMHPGLGGKPPMRLRFFHPGTILPPGTTTQPVLPESLSISITREGKKPAKIVVKQNENQWELTENDLDQLPKEIRPHVERMLHGTVVESMPQFDFLPSAKPRGALKPKSPTATRPSIDWLREHLRRMDQQMDQMRDWVEKLEKEPAQPELKKNK